MIINDRSKDNNLKYSKGDRERDRERWERGEEGREIGTSRTGCID